MEMPMLFAAALLMGALQSIPVEMTVPMPPRPARAGGRTHLIYELHVSNLGHAPLTLTRIEARDGTRTVASYDGEALKSILARPGTPGLPDRRAIGPGLRAVAFLDVVDDAAHILTHRLTFEPVTPTDASSVQTTVDGGDVRVGTAPPIVIGPPLKGGNWVALHGLSNESVHRRTLITLNGKTRISQRFAIDWTRIGADGQVFRGDPAKNENWTPYGAEVLAVADGTVSDLDDGVPANDPTSDTKAVPITFDNAGGNYVILDIGHGHYAFYAHLQAHSLRVRLGERVHRGEVLALLGNSGKADAPHLHFHITDANSPFASEGVPFAIDRFTLLGHVGSLKILADGTGWHATETPTLRTREMAVENAVVAFP